MKGICRDWDGEQMLAPFDIFKLESPDKAIWTAAADNLQAAKAKVALLMAKSPCDYAIFDLRTQETLLVKRTV